MDARCPRCGGALKAGAQWCGLCYADLRPPPPAPPAPPEPPAPAVPQSAPVFAPVAATSAPSTVADGSVADGAAAAEPAKGWPCMECGAVNSFELEACASCGLPFGSALRTPAPTLPGDRRTRIGIALAVAILLIGLIALLTSATGGELTDDPDAPLEITVDG